jgi:methylglyoxal synthase
MHLHSEKLIALVAHDNRKPDLVEWVEWNYLMLLQHKLICTGTTGKLIKEAITRKLLNLNPHIKKVPEISTLKSGPLGGDQQLGSMITDGLIDMMIFFWDPLSAQPHDTDVKALLRIAVLYNIPIACNRATADFLICSSLMNSEYEKKEYDFAAYITRFDHKGLK